MRHFNARLDPSHVRIFNAPFSGGLGLKGSEQPPQILTPCVAVQPDGKNELQLAGTLFLRLSAGCATSWSFADEAK